MRNVWFYFGLAAIVSASGCAAAVHHEPGESAPEEGAGEGEEEETEGFYGGPVAVDSSATDVTPSINGKEIIAKVGKLRGGANDSSAHYVQAHESSAGGEQNEGSSVDPPANDTCNSAEVIALTIGASAAEIQGELIDARDDLTTFCADTSTETGNPDVVYQFHLDAPASVSIQLSATGFVPALSLRRTMCEYELAGDSCQHYGSSLYKMVELDAGTYWIVVDSADGYTGVFTLMVSAREPMCGDAVLNEGEECDPGDGTPDDGCHDPGSADECAFGETPTNTDVTHCDGFGPINLLSSNDPEDLDILRLGPFNNGAGGHSEENDTTEDIMVCGWAATGPEDVFHVVPQSNGTLHARIGHDDQGNVMCDLLPNCGDFILYMRSGSCEHSPEDPAQQMACADWDPNNQEILEISAPVTAGMDYWVFVDGYNDEFGVGPYFLELWLVDE